MSAIATSTECPVCRVDPRRAFRPGAPAGRAQVNAAEDAAALVIPLLSGRDREHCVLVTLDSRSRLIGVRTVSVGTVDHTFMATDVL